MGSKAPGWGEQWSAEGYGGNDDDDKLMNKVGNSSGSKMRDVKAARTFYSFDWMNENLYTFQKNNQEHFT